jgi:hypothetical protein
MSWYFANEAGHMNELRDMIRNMRLMLEAYEQGPVRDQLQGRFDRMSERLRALPRRVADQGPFADRDEAQAVLTKEFAYVVAAIDGTN